MVNNECSRMGSTYHTGIFVYCSSHGIDVHFPGLFVDWNVSNLHVEVCSCLLVIQFTYNCKVHLKKSVIVVVGKFLKKKCWCVRIWFWSLLVPKSVKWRGTNIFILREIWTCTVYTYVYTVCIHSMYTPYVLWVGTVINNNEIVPNKNMHMYLCFYSILY